MGTGTWWILAFLCFSISWGVSGVIYLERMGYINMTQDLLQWEPCIQKSGYYMNKDNSEESGDCIISRDPNTAPDVRVELRCEANSGVTSASLKYLSAAGREMVATLDKVDGTQMQFKGFGTLNMLAVVPRQCKVRFLN